MSYWLIAYLAALGVSLLHGSLLALQTFEFRRYARSRCRPRAAQHAPLRTVLVAPCKGLDPNLAENLRPLLRQDHGNYELRFIVESEHDPACAAIRRLMAEHPGTPARLLVAGVAHRGGQKVHNLLAATADLPDEVQAVAFVDSDARPRSDWLQNLVEPLARPRVAAVTAYRWMAPLRSSLALHVLYSINSAVTPLVGPGRHHMVWGGAWAIRRSAFQACGLREAWRGTLSDDLVAAQTLARARVRVQFQPACIVESPIDLQWPQMLEFVHRQYTIGRVYSPTWWRGALAVVSLVQLTFWIGAAAALAGAPSGAAWWWMPTLGTAALYVLQAARAWLRQDAVRFFQPELYARLKVARRFDIWLGPLAGLVNWWALAAAARSRRIVWRGIQYEMAADGQACIVSRPAPQSTATSSASDSASRQGPFKKAG